MAPINSTKIHATETLAFAALQAAAAQLGQCEHPKGSNRGPMVNEYLQSVGLSPGYAWCQAFVYWCYKMAAEKTGVVNPVVKTGSVHNCWNDTTSNTTVIKLLKAEIAKRPELVKPGDQFILFYNDSAGHTGIVERVTGSVLHTIEGNSNSNGSREGYEVARHQRSIDDKTLIGFVRYTANTGFTKS